MEKKLSRIKVNRNFKIVFFAVLLTLLSVLIITVNASDYSQAIMNSRSDGINLKDSNVVEIDQTIDRQYSFGLGADFDSSESIVNGEETLTDANINCWNTSFNWNFQHNTDINSYSLARNSIKGNYSILYKKVGIYNNMFIDVKATVMDFEVQNKVNTTCEPYIYMRKDKIENSTVGLVWYTIKYEFFKSGTTEPVSLKGNTSYWDVDGKQGVILNDNNIGLYATDDTILEMSSVNGDIYIFDKTGTGDDGTHTAYGFTEIFEGSSITRTYTYGISYSQEEWATNPGGYTGGMAHSALPVVPVELPEMTKEVSKNEITKDEEFAYILTQQVPQQYPQNYYEEITMEDTLSEILNVREDNIEVKNENDENITEKFDVKVEGQKVTVSTKSSSLPELHGHTYKIYIKTKVKENTDFSSAYRHGNYYIVSNIAERFYRSAHESGISETTPPVPIAIKVPVTVNYEIVTDNNPPAELTDETPAEENKNAGDEYTPKEGLTTRYTDKRCTFNGWYTNRGLTGSKYTGSTLTEDLTLYGGWTCDDKVEVNYHLVGEEVLNQSSLPVKEEKYVNDTYTAKDGLTTTYKDKKCDFNGWYTNEQLSGTKYIEGILTGNLDLYGKWNCEDLIKEPSKEVSKTNIKVGEDYTYKIKHEVPNITDNNYYYSKYEIKDNIDTVLEVKEIKVETETGEDVTDKFNITNNNNVVIKPNSLTDSTFYNHTYSYIIKVSLKENQDLTGHTKNENEYVIENKGETLVNNNELDTEIVNVKVKEVKVNYHLVGENVPNASELPAEEKQYIGEEYTAKSGLTTTYTDKRCTFKGWYKTNTLSGTKFISEKLDGDLDLYGGWSCDNKVEVNYHLIGEEVPNQSSLPEKEEKYVGDSYSAKPGLTTTYKDKKCTFNGWYSNNNLTGNKYISSTLTESLDLYGKWDCVDLIKKPIKEVSKTSVKEGEEYTYKIKHEVPNITDSNYYYSKYEIKDSIDKALEVKEIKVETDTDVTNKFNITNNNNAVTITPKNLNDQSFYNHTYTYIIKVKVVLQENKLNLEDYKESDRYVINNKGKALVNSNELETDTVKITYTPKYTLTVHHYKKGTTDKIGDSITEEKYEGESYTTSPLTNIEEGYELVGTPTNASGTITEDTVVIYEYELKDFTLTVNHYKEGTTESLAPSETYNKKYGEEYTTNKSNSIGEEYELVEEPTNKEGTVKENTTVNYFYKLKKATLTVRYLEEGTNKKLSNEKIEQKNYTDEYETEEANDIPENYILKEKPNNYRGIINGDTIVTYYYQKKDSNIVPKITKEGTEEINTRNSKVKYQINYKADFTDYIDKATITIKDKLPYKIDITNSNIDGGTYNENDKTITWTEEVDINSYTNPSKQITKNIEVLYLNIDSKQRVITNEIEGNIKGNDKDITVKNTFNTKLLIPGEIIIKYIDKGTGEEIIPQEVTTNLVGEEYSLPAEKEIEGYQLIEKPEKLVYEYKEETQIIKYYYDIIKVKVETKAGQGGTIEGDENIYYGEDSTKDKIRIKANPGYVIDKIKINGQEIEVPEESSEMTISNFVKMTEDKLVEVTFKEKPLVVNAPKTSSFISKIILAMGFILIIISSVFIHNKIKDNA